MTIYQMLKRLNPWRRALRPADVAFYTVPPFSVVRS
jgi:hypothetical protein